MIKIALELQDMNIENIDLSFPEKGNPGIGGSEWLFLLLASYLYKKFENKYIITIYHYNHNSLPKGVNEIIIKNEFDIIDMAKTNQESILIHQINKRKEWYENLDKTDINAIPWAHCYISYPEVLFITRASCVKRVVFVGKEEYDSYIDDDIIKKSTYIYNMLNTKEMYITRNNEYENVVTYMGSLVKEKAFHYLAEVWPDIKIRVPNAKLQVIGSGKLYNRNSKLGKYGFAESSYESMFMKYLTDKDGNILDDVSFLGILGDEKVGYFKNTAVGVVNPIGKDETFCLSAVEMELCGIPIVSVRKYGLLDTIKHTKTGLLYKNKKEFVNYVVKLLLNHELNNQYGDSARNYAKEKFDIDKIIYEWDALFESVITNVNIPYIPCESNYFNDLKWLRIINRNIRKIIKQLPSINKYKYYLKKMLR